MENLSEGRWLRSAVAEAGFSVAAFARKASVSRESLNKWFGQPILLIRPDTLLKVLTALGYGPLKGLSEEVELIEHAPYIPNDSRPMLQREMTRKIMNHVRWMHERGTGGQGAQASDARDAWDHNVDLATAQRMAPVPMFDMHVAAGQWVEVSGEGVAPDLATFDRGVFRVRIHGNSMERKYPDGAIVEFALVQPDRESVVVGKNYYWHRADNFATFKTLEKIEDETLYLRAINKRHYPKPLTVAKQEVVRVAVARGMFIPDE